jgi:hypothetical protein
MTTPTIDSALSGQTTGTIKVPDYTSVLTDIATALNYRPSQSCLAVGTITGSVATVVAPNEIQPGFFVTGTGIPPGTFVTTVGGTMIAYVLNLSTSVNTPLTGTFTFMSPLIAQTQALVQLKELLITTGVKTYDPYDLVSKASSYAYYSEHPDELTALLAKLPGVPNATLDQIKTALQPVTKF